MAARQIVAATVEGGHPNRPFRPLPWLKAAETGHMIRKAIAVTEEYKLRRGDGGGARLRLWGSLRGQT
jgi:hypothetical protein